MSSLGLLVFHSIYDSRRKIKMTTVQELRDQVNNTFLEIFGRTPLKERLEDILGEAIELQRYTDLRNLREEASDLLASLIMLYNEAEWDIEESLQETLQKIYRRREQYHTLGRKVKVAVFGGAFDPITQGHINTAQFVLNTSKKFDEVWLMPCYSHMNGKYMAPPQERLDMCRIAARIDGRIRVSDYEIANQLSGETYKLAKLLLNDKEYEQCNFSFIIGQDNANDFHNWVNFEELERLAPFIVVPRPGVEPDYGHPWYLKPPHTYLVGERTIHEISSTKIRMYYASIKKLIDYPAEQLLGGLIQHSMDEGVMSYIAKNDLDQHYAERGKLDWEKQQNDAQ